MTPAFQRLRARYFLTWMGRHPIRFLFLCPWLLAVPFAAAGCAPLADASNNSPEQGSASTDGGGHGASYGLLLDDAGLPFAFLDANLTQPCEPNSALCYELCGAPSCALGDNTISPELANPPVSLADGALTDDSCVQIESESLAIRTESCAACHGPGGTGAAGINYILNDQTLLMSKSSTGVPMIVPGDPVDSFIYQQVLHGIQGSQTGMPPLNPTVGGLPPDASIPRPTSADLSILYAWILNCVGSDGGNAYASSSYGGDYGSGSVTDGSEPLPEPVATDGGAGQGSVDAGGAGPGTSPPTSILNGDFTQGTAYWAVSEGSGTLSVTDGQLCASVTANEQVTLGWPQDGLAGMMLSAGQSYTFAYAIQTTTATGITVMVKVANTNGPSYVPIDYQATEAATNNLTTVTAPFTLGTQGDTSAGLAFTFTSTVDQSLCIANVSLTAN